MIRDAKEVAAEIQGWHSGPEWNCACVPTGTEVIRADRLALLDEVRRRIGEVRWLGTVQFEMAVTAVLDALREEIK